MHFFSSGTKLGWARCCTDTRPYQTCSSCVTTVGLRLLPWYKFSRFGKIGRRANVICPAAAPPEVGQLLQFVFFIQMSASKKRAFCTSTSYEMRSGLPKTELGRAAEASYFIHRRSLPNLLRDELARKHRLRNQLQQVGPARCARPCC